MRPADEQCSWYSFDASYCSLECIPNSRWVADSVVLVCVYLIGQDFFGLGEPYGSAPLLSSKRISSTSASADGPSLVGYPKLLEKACCVVLGLVYRSLIERPPNFLLTSKCLTSILVVSARRKLARTVSYHTGWNLVSGSGAGVGDSCAYHGPNAEIPSISSISSISSMF